MSSPVNSTDRFLRFARVRLRDQPHKYAVLVNMLTRFAAVEVRTEVEELLRDVPILIAAFNGLLPPELWIPSPATPSNLNEALDLMFRIRARAQQLQGPGSDLYESFMRIFRRRNTTRLEVAREAMDLLRDHTDLRDRFFFSLPPDLRSSL